MDLAIGQTVMRSITLTAEHVSKYADLTGDRKPVHFDQDFAAKTRFGRPIVQGGLTTGLLNALVAMDMPGPGTVFLVDIDADLPVDVDTSEDYERLVSVMREEP